MLREYNESGSGNNNAMYHPFMLKDSSLIFICRGLFILNKANQLKLLNLEFIFHHIIEAQSGRAFWLCECKRSLQKNLNNGIDITVVEDVIIGFYIIHKKIFHVKKISQLLIENGYENLFRSSGRLSKDCFHINDIQPVKITSNY